MNRLWVFLGATQVGALVRYFVDMHWGGDFRQLSLATLAINLMGSFIAGFFISIGESGVWSREMTVTLIAGLCGALTTLSGLSSQSLLLYEQGEWKLSAFLVFGTAFFGLVMVWLGRASGRVIVGGL
ncbi:MAG: CrcB family protein [Oligoflexia bacterium]|nr:CrcB family protein [Oligoflexia bacterium]